MATALQPAPISILHPAVARQLEFARWNDDPAVQRLFAALRDAAALGRRLQELAGDRPELGARDAVSDLGYLYGDYRADLDCRRRPEFVIVPTGGACATLWRLLTERRAAWVAAKLEGEGLRHDLQGDAAAYFERSFEIDCEALDMQAAWAEFCTADVEFDA